jgi:hypothetical protein
MPENTNEEQEKNKFKKYFQGIIVMIDDQLDGSDANKDTDIVKIKEDLERDGFLVKTFTSFPTSEELEYLNISLVITDWNINNASTSDELSQNASLFIGLLENIYKHSFPPMLIGSDLSMNKILNYGNKEAKLKNYPLYKNGGSGSAIMFKAKGDLKDKKLYKVINDWLDACPSINVMKDWELSINGAKSNLFKEFYQADVNWPKVLYKTYGEDYKDSTDTNDTYANHSDHINNEIGQFITKNLLSRIPQFVFSVDENYPDSTNISEVLGGERFFKYGDQTITANTIFKTGDIIKRNGELWINIRRECDTIRDPNPSLYLLKCKTCKINEWPISVKQDNTLMKLKVDNSLYDLSSATNAVQINKKIKTAMTRTKVISKGAILENKFECIVPCMLDAETYIISVKELKIDARDKLIGRSRIKRIGRLLEPYIGIILNKFAMYTTLKGTMKIPDILFGDQVISDE